MTEIISKPDRGAEIIDEDGVASDYLQTYFDDLEKAANGNPQVNFTSYSKDELPPVTSESTPGLIFVSDATGGAVPAFNDGTNWRRVNDLSIIN